MSDPTAQPMKDYGALYYPRIHFNDLEWLKGTLLAFGSVHRIVPVEHPLDRDPPEVRQISARHGGVLPVVIEINPEWAPIEFAQSRLHQALDKTDGVVLKQRFGLEALRAVDPGLLLGAGGEGGEVHRGVITS
jgi:hypothetical protein